MGLLSAAQRAARAGFRMDERLYWGGTRNAPGFRDGLIHLATEPRIANQYARGKGLGALLGYAEGGHVRPLVTRGELMDVPGLLVYADELERAAREAREQGYSGLRARVWDRGGPQDQVIMFRGRDVRSPHARFMDLGSNDILAGLGAAAPAGGLLSALMDQQRLAGQSDSV